MEACCLKRSLLLRLLVLLLFPLEWSAASSEEKLLLCSEKYDRNGQWQGSRAVGGNYTLRCAEGFQVSGHGGSTSWNLTCHSGSIWKEDIYCVNVDDCATLKHGCGALGVCLDLVGSYDCNCERGYYSRHRVDGEIVCGLKGMDVCHGHTCSAYGVCIDLQGNDSQFEDDKPSSSQQAKIPTYRCECTDGFFDNGVTCQRHDCGNLTDKLGIWTGSTTFGGEYTLRCPEGGKIWGGELEEITISCGRLGKWLSNPICVSPLSEELEKGMAALEFWSLIGLVLLCVTSAALAAGLTLGLATLEPFALTVILATRLEDCITPEERQELKIKQAHAQQILPLVRDHHLLLVTLLLFNTVANEALPVFLDELVPPWAAVLLSVSVVLVCGEILPSAVFTGPNQFAIASALVPVVRTLKVLFFVVAKPLAMMLDRMIKEDSDATRKYSRAELRALLALHSPKAQANEGQVSESVDDIELPHSISCCSGGIMATESTPFTAMQIQESVVLQTGNSSLSQSTEHEKEALSRSELKFAEGVLALRDKKLSRKSYTRLNRCFLANNQLRAVDVVENMGRENVGMARRRAGCFECVLVLKDGAVASAGSSIQQEFADSGSDDDSPVAQASEPSSPASPKVQLRARFVEGCIHLQDLVKCGLEPLKNNLQPLVLLPEDSSLSQVLAQLRDNNTTIGVVTREPLDGGSALVRGCVHFSQVLRFLLDGPPPEAVHTEPRTDVPASPAGTPWKKTLFQERLILKRTNSTIAEIADQLQASNETGAPPTRQKMSLKARYGRAQTADFAATTVSADDGVPLTSLKDRFQHMP